MNDGAKSLAAETWRERIAAQQADGQSIRALCKENGWQEHAFYWWRSRLGLSPRPVVRRRRRRTAQGGFAEVVVDRPLERPAVAGRFEAGAAAPILLRLGGGRELVLPVSMADERVATLIHLIEGKPPTIEGKPPIIEGWL